VHHGVSFLQTIKKDWNKWEAVCGYESNMADNAPVLILILSKKNFGYNDIENTGICLMRDVLGDFFLWRRKKEAS
jgi:hypothetical protein